MSTIDRRAYADMFGPTVGDRVRLGDTELWIEVEEDKTVYGEEVKFGGGKVIRDGMGQSQRVSKDAVDVVITNALILDHWGIVKADIGIKEGRIVGVGKAGNPDIQSGVDIIIGPSTEAIAGEVKSNVKLDIEKIVRGTINKVGYTKEEYKFSGNTCKINNFLHQQSEDINRGVERAINEDQGAGDQGIMFGYATDETENLIPLALDLAHKILIELSLLRKECSQIKYLRPDSKSQVTIKYDSNGIPKNIDTIVVSTQHDPFEKDDLKMLNRIKDDVKNILIPRIIEKENTRVKSLFNNEITYHINPTGKFVIGGPHGDRKSVV